MYFLRLFGAVELAHAGRPLRLPLSRKGRALLTLLALQRQPLVRELAASALWPDLPDTRAHRNLNNTLWRLRQALGTQAVLADAEALRLNPSDWVIDVHEFEAKAASAPAEAVRLYRGDLVPELYDDFVLRERERLREVYLEALRRLRQEHEAAGDLQSALNCARQLLAADPVREDVHRDVMRLLAALGRSAEALAQFEICRATLAGELGVEPARDTLALQREIAASRAASLIPGPSVLERLPLVGRREEMVRLLAALESALASQGGLILIEGEAGLGKTRLLMETADAARWRDMLVLAGRAREGGATRPYHPLVEAVRSGMTGPRLYSLKRLPESVRALAAGLLPELGPAAFPTAAEPDSEARLEAAIAKVISVIGANAPLVLLLDDLHWADLGTLRLFSALADEPILTVASARSEELRDRPDLWAVWRNLDRFAAARLRLDRLNRIEAEALVKNLLSLPQFELGPGPSAEARRAPIEAVYTATGGNPFLIIEWLRTWLESPSETAAALGEVGPLPGARWRYLQPAELEALEWMSVVGREVEPELVERLEPQVGDLFSQLAALVRRRYLSEGPTGYGFNHDLIRQAIYGRVPSDRRREMHRQVARALQPLSPDRADEQARHLTAAEEWPEAARAWLAAGAASRALSANSAAEVHFSHALEAARRADEPALIFEAAFARGDLLRFLGRAEAAIADLEAMRQAAERLADDRRLTEADLALSHAWVHADKYAEGDMAAERALARASALGDDLLQASALHRQASNAWGRGEYVRAVELVQEAIALLRAAGNRGDAGGFALRPRPEGPWPEALSRKGRRLLAPALTDLAVFCMFQHSLGNPASEMGLAALREAIALYQQEGMMDRLAIGLANLGHWQTLLGNYPEAARAFAEAGGLYEAHGYFAGRTPAWVAWGFVLGELGERATAQARLAEAVALAESSRDLQMLAVGNVHRARLAMRAGELGLAWSLCVEALRSAQASEKRETVLFAKAVQGALLRGLGDPTSAWRIHSQCVEEARGIADRSLEAAALIQSGCDLCALDRADEALEYLTQAKRLAHEMNRRSLLVEALAASADARRRVGDFIAAVPEAREALQISREMGAGYWMAEAHIALAQALADSGSLDEAGGTVEQGWTGMEAYPPLALIARTILGRLALARRDWASARDHFLRAEALADRLADSLLPGELRQGYTQAQAGLLSLPHGFRWVILPDLKTGHRQRALWPVRVEAGPSRVERRRAVSGLIEIAQAQAVRPTNAVLASALALSARSIRRLRAAG